MNSISPDTEHQCRRVLKHARQLTREGKTPNQAIAKAASDEKLPSGFIPLVCAAYNTGMQESQRLAETGSLAKFATFPLAQPEAVRQELYPDEVPTPAKKAAQTAVADEYRRPPAQIDWASRDSRQLLAFPKAAAEVPQPTVQRTVDRPIAKLATLKRAAEEAERTADWLHVELDRGARRLAGYFKYSSERLPFGVVKAAAVAQHGAPAETLLTLAYKQAYLRESPEAASQSLICYQPQLEPYRIIDHCFDLARRKQAADVAAKQARESYERAVQETLHPFVEAPHSTPRKSAGLLDNTFSGISGAVGGLTMRSVEDRLSADPNRQALKTWSKLEDPHHDAELRGIRTQAMLNDLMANDPVISGFDADEVLGAYNELTQLAPRASLQPAAMRSWLRRKLQGHQEPFEVKEIADTEKALVESSPAMREQFMMSSMLIPSAG
jgi:hypothetical protein